MTTFAKRLTILAALLALALPFTGCSDHASQVLGGDTGTGDGGGTGDTGDDAVEFAKGIADAAVEVDSMTQTAMAGETTSIQGDPMLEEVGRPSPSNVERSIERIVPCPAGGELSVAGMLDGMFDRDTRTLEINGSGTRTATACTMERNGMTITIDGSSSWEWMRRYVNGMPDGLQTRRYYGSWTAVNDDGLTRTCEFDYSVSYDPLTRTTSAEGNLCGSPLQPRQAWKGVS